MRTFIIITAFLIGLSQATFADSLEKKYRYEGDASAKTVCMAIAKDQVNRLHRALRANKIGFVDNKVHKRFACNGKDLLSFAQDIGATDVERFLSPKFSDRAKEALTASEKS